MLTGYDRDPADCDCCKAAQTWPHMYRNDCVGCIARGVNDMPRAAQPDAVAALLPRLSDEQRFRFLVLLGE